MQDDSIKIPCSRCSGRGFLPGNPDDTSSEDCIRCSGTGELIPERSVAEWESLKDRLGRYALTESECSDRFSYHLDDGGFLIGACCRCGYSSDSGGVGCP